MKSRRNTTSRREHDFRQHIATYGSGRDHSCPQPSASRNRRTRWGCPCSFRGRPTSGSRWACRWRCSTATQWGWHAKWLNIYMCAERTYSV
jgi:hypothetical protein